MTHSDPLAKPPEHLAEPSEERSTAPLLEKPEPPASTGEEPALQPAAQAMDRESVRKTGRGFLVITAAKVWFLVTSAVVQLGLPIIFGSPEDFGVFKIVTEAIGLLNMVMIAGTLQAVSKLVSEEPRRASRVVGQALRLQAFIAVPIALGYGLGSPLIAGRFFNDPALAPLIGISSLIIGFYAFYAVFVGYLNGLKEFVRQATLDIGFSTLKMGLILGLVLAGLGVSGAVWGFVAAAGLICVVAALWTWRLMRSGALGLAAAPAQAPGGAMAGDGEESAGWGRLFGYLAVVMLYTFALNGIMRADLFLLKSVAAAAPEGLVGMEGAFKILSDRLAGFYGAALNLARLPYQGVIAVTFVIFPLISEATFAKDIEKTRGYVQETFRYCLLLIAGVGLLLALNSGSLIAALYSPDYQAAAEALAILSVSIIFFALLYVATTMITGAGRPLVAFGIMGSSLGLSGLLNYWLVGLAHAQMAQALAGDPGALARALEAPAGALAEPSAAPMAQHLSHYLNMAAWATTASMVFGFVLSLVWFYRHYRASLPLGTLARLVLAAGLLYPLGRLWPLGPEALALHGKLLFLAMLGAKLALMGLVLLAVLVLGREFGERDLARVRAVLGKK